MALRHSPSRRRGASLRFIRPHSSHHLEPPTAAAAPPQLMPLPAQDAPSADGGVPSTSDDGGDAAPATASANGINGQQQQPATPADKGTIRPLFVFYTFTYRAVVVADRGIC